MLFICRLLVSVLGTCGVGDYTLGNNLNVVVVELTLFDKIDLLHAKSVLTSIEIFLGDNDANSTTL